MSLTEEQLGELEAAVPRLAAEGNPIAQDLQLRLMECETPAERAEVLSRFAEQLQALEPAITTLIQGVAAGVSHTLTPAIQQAIDLAMPVFRALSDRVWEAYHDAGAPYGDTEEGLHTWLAEQSAAAAAREREEERRLWKS